RALDSNLVFPAFDYELKCSHTFNLLDAGGAISVSARAGYIGRVRSLAQQVCRSFLEERRKLGFPLMKDRSAAQLWVEQLAPKEVV
ncbi:MAG: glycine--tRNA ligase subunit alpha, partial [SAR324 cluster bacterium]|nr:glycine--tRNA ligase subunit alpha [SAR324 cluster bacterium]